MLLTIEHKVVTVLIYFKLSQKYAEYFKFGNGNQNK